MKNKCIIGAVHLPPFENAYVDYSRIESWLVENIRIHYENGITNIMIQDQTPGKKASLKTITYLSSLGRIVKNSFPNINMGIIIEANDAEALLHIANASGADFVRIKVYVGAMVKAGGIIEGCASTALRTKSELDRKIKILTDIYDRMGSPLGALPFSTAAQHAIKYGSDGLILTGDTQAETIEMLLTARKRFDSIPLYAGGGVTMQNVLEILELCDGAVVSSCLMKDGYSDSWDSDKINHFMQKVNG